MKQTHRECWILLVLAIAGTGVCLAALIGFVVTVMNNNLDWRPGQTMRDYYVAIGHSYGDGFLVGFFLCFFLSLAATAVAAGRNRKRSLPQRSEPDPVLSH